MNYLCSRWALFKILVATVQSIGGISIATKRQRPFDIQLILVMSASVTALTATGISTDCADTPTTGSFLNHRFRTEQTGRVMPLSITNTIMWGSLRGQLYKTGEGGELGRNTRASIQRGKPFISIRLSRLRLFLTVRLLTQCQLLSTYKSVHQQDNK